MVGSEADSRESNWLSALLRQPFAIMGALGVLSFAHDAVDWSKDVLSWIDAWRSFTRPIVQFVFGWIPAMFHFYFPGWAKDYLSIGTIISSSSERSTNYYISELDPESHILIPRRVISSLRAGRRVSNGDVFYVLIVYPLIYLEVIISWPIQVSTWIFKLYVLFRTYSYKTIKNDPIVVRDRRRLKRFFYIIAETVGWLAIIMVINYVMLKRSGS